MGIGYALTEELPCEDGMPVTFGLRELGVLRARDMPLVEVILIEDEEPEGDVAFDLYRRHLCVDFVHKIREERRFPSIDQLVRQIGEDTGRAREYLRDPSAWH